MAPHGVGRTSAGARSWPWRCSAPLAGVVSYEAIDPGNQAPYDPRTEAPAGVTIDPMDPDYIGYVPNDAVIPTRDGFFVPDPEAHGFKKVSPPTADPDRDGDG